MVQTLNEECQQPQGLEEPRDQSVLESMKRTQPCCLLEFGILVQRTMKNILLLSEQPEDRK